MAISKSAKIMAEIEKVKAKISDQQARLKELEQKHKEAENEEIVDIVRGMSISLEELPLVLQRIKAGDALGQNVPKYEKPGSGTAPLPSRSQLHQRGKLFQQIRQRPPQGGVVPLEGRYFLGVDAPVGVGMDGHLIEIV